MKPIITYIVMALLLVLSAFLAFNWYSARQEAKEQAKLRAEEQQSFDARSRIVSRSDSIVIDSLVKTNATLAASVLKYRAHYDSLEAADKKIIYKFNMVRNENRHLNDSAKLALTRKLLADHSQLGVIIGN